MDRPVIHSSPALTIAERVQLSHLSGANRAWIEALYEQWLTEPATVPAEWSGVFAALGPGPDSRHRDIAERFRVLARHPAPAATSSAVLDHKQAGVLKLINAYRVRGHQKADLDPLRLSARPPVPDLDLSFHDLDDGDLDREFDTGSLHAPDRLSLQAIVTLLDRVYCGSIGAEYMHIVDTTQRRWLQERLEGSGGNFAFNADERRRFLAKLTAAEGLERYLHTRYVGQKRFSLEGAESLIPLLYEMIHHAGRQAVREVVIGMAHRGRLNVLVNILGKQPADLFEEFEGKVRPDNISRSGDVKYHLGYSSDMLVDGEPIHLALAFNPSHLEIVDPVVVGFARARQTRHRDREHRLVLPVLIHGDAAFAGQGVVMELFNMSQARGFKVGGTVHIVVNNQIGFTTSNPLDARSTLYCTEVAKLVQAPILHVNGDDPEAVVFCARLAHDFRARFGKDVVLDLVCYRRHGHNEADEPAATQPLMYRTIHELPTTREKYAARLAADGVVEAAAIATLSDEYRAALDDGRQVADVQQAGVHHAHNADWSPFQGNDWRMTADTRMAPETIARLAAELHRLPAGFVLHDRVRRIIDDRRKMAAGEMPIDWGFAETMAYAGLIEDGYALRLVGQDSGRGTFFHRHAILHEQQTGQTLVPLERFAGPTNPVTVIDSLLSEEAVLGFEYGYASADPETLVIWEAQFGDFANGAQVVIDQFISSGEAKWGRLCALTLYLPHGYEGQGPEHSSARLERFMQLCAGDNMQVCVPSLPAQWFHLIRRQMLRLYRKPLIVMTPKSLLRHKDSTSSLADLSTGAFQPLLDDPAAPDPAAVRRLVFCAGKVYFDLAKSRGAQQPVDTALVRIEQLYPFPHDELAAAVRRYAAAEDIVWCQEEPLNQGAYRQIRDWLAAALPAGRRLRAAGRPPAASPAVGYHAIHLAEQQALVRDALGLTAPAQSLACGNSD